MVKPEIQVPNPVQARQEHTTLAAKLVNIFVNPGDVFDEVLAEPIRPATWMVPTLLVFFSGLLLLSLSTPPEHTSAAVRQLIEAGQVAPSQATAIIDRWFSISALAVFVSAFAGTIWSALVLWGMARMLLKVAVPFSKALEVAGLVGMILVLGTIVTTLLILASGNPLTRPALSFLASGLCEGSTLRAALEVFNGFYLWSTAVLAIGLSRLTGVSLRECAFWAFSYWLVLRISLISLG
jgi:hypothetical protein